MASRPPWYRSIRILPPKVTDTNKTPLFQPHIIHVSWCILTLIESGSGRTLKSLLHTVTFGFVVHDTLQYRHTAILLFSCPRCPSPAPCKANPEYSAAKSEYASVCRGGWMMVVPRRRFIAKSKQPKARQKGCKAFGGDAIVIDLFLGLEKPNINRIVPRS